MPDLVYLNGQYLAREQACVSVMDRGFLFGDGVYEVVPAYGGLPFRLHGHLARLERSLKAIHMDNPLTTEQWGQVVLRLLQQSPGEDQQVYVQVTRGSYAERSHAIPAEVKPTVMAFSSRLPGLPQEWAQTGISAITVADIRWQRCDIKAITLLANVLSHSQAKEVGAQEAILVRDGLALEGTASNLFIVQAGTLLTPPNGQHLLPGVTRDLMLELAAKHGLRHAEADIPVAQLAQADEVWLTSSSREIMPVTAVDGKPVANGQPGPIWQQMNFWFAECKASLRQSTADECL